MPPEGLTHYKKTQIETATPLQLVVMLYDGAVENLQRAKNAIADNDVALKSRSVDKALAIVGELQATLDMEEGGEIARSLNALYAYACEQIVEASVSMNAAPLDSVTSLLTTLRSAWHEISQRPASEIAASLPKRSGETGAVPPSPPSGNVRAGVEHQEPAHRVSVVT
jgi:flagellar protein FliS